MARGISDTLKAAIPDSLTALGIRIGTVDNDVVLINSSNRDILFGGKNYAARSNLMEVGDFSESLELKSPQCKHNLRPGQQRCGPTVSDPGCGGLGCGDNPVLVAQRRACGRQHNSVAGFGYRIQG